MNKVIRKSRWFALTDCLLEEYNELIDTDGVIDIYPNVKIRTNICVTGADK